MNISSINSLATLATSASQPVQPPNPEQKALIQAIRAVNLAEMFGQDNELTFIIDRAAHIAVARVVNRKTGEVVLQIPNEEVLRMAEESTTR